MIQTDDFSCLLVQHLLRNFIKYLHVHIELKVGKGKVAGLGRVGARRRKGEGEERTGGGEKGWEVRREVGGERGGGSGE